MRMNSKTEKSLVLLTISFTDEGQLPEGAWLGTQRTTEYIDINQKPRRFNGEDWRSSIEHAVDTTGLMVWKARLIITEQDGESYPIDLFFEAE